MMPATPGGKKHIRHAACWVVGVVLLFVAGCPSAWANPANQKAFAEYLGPLLPRKLAGCETCHAASSTERPQFNASIGKPHNPFGARLMAVADELKKARRKIDIGSRLDAVAKEDSDGDSVSNLFELLTGHHPGRKQDRPTRAELARAAGSEGSGVIGTAVSGLVLAHQ